MNEDDDGQVDDRQNAQLMSTKERAYAGCIVTLADQESNRTRVEHVGGYYWEHCHNYVRTTITHTMTDALSILLRDVATWEGDWKVRCISTPQSTLVDLRGRAVGIPLPETAILAQIDRLDMWEHKSA